MAELMSFRSKIFNQDIFGLQAQSSFHSIMLNQFSDGMILNEIFLIVFCSVSESYYSFTLEFFSKMFRFLYARFRVKQSRCNNRGSEQLRRNELEGNEKVSAEETTFCNECR